MIFVDCHVMVNYDYVQINSFVNRPENMFQNLRTYDVKLLLCQFMNLSSRSQIYRFHLLGWRNPDLECCLHCVTLVNSDLCNSRHSVAQIDVCRLRGKNYS